MLGDHILPITLLPLRVNLSGARLFQPGQLCSLGHLPQFVEYCRSTVRGCPANAGFSRQTGDRQTAVRPGRIARDKPGERFAKCLLG
jgi:hypothetical protein